jgi:sugar (pentulose or hexulose) kinase
MNPYWDAGARGAFVGLTSSHRRGHLYRSILEGIAFEQRLALNAVEEEIGTRIGELVVIGGGAGSELWCRIFADVTGKTIHRPRNADASGLGAAVAAAVGAGWYASFREAARAMTGAAKNVEPDKRATVEYRRRFRIYKELYPALRFTL